MAIITGAGDGIGRAIANTFVAEGASVSIAELRESTGQAASDALGERIHFLRTHVGSMEQVEAMAAAAVGRWAATRTAASEWADTGITAKIVCPAAKSAAFRKVMSQHPELEPLADAAIRRVASAIPTTTSPRSSCSSRPRAVATSRATPCSSTGGSHINGSSWAPDLGD